MSGRVLEVVFPGNRIRQVSFEWGSEPCLPEGSAAMFIYWISFVYTMYNSIPLKVKKWGNSLGIRINRPLAEFLNLGEDDDIHIILNNDHAVLVKKDDVEAYYNSRERGGFERLLDELLLDARNRERNSPRWGEKGVRPANGVMGDIEEIVQETDEVAESEVVPGEPPEEVESVELAEEADGDDRKREGRPRDTEEDVLEESGALMGIRLPRPIYSGRRGGRMTPLKLTDVNFEDAVKKYPVLVVMFIDYLYLDFYDTIMRELSSMEGMARLFRGKIWFAVAEEERNTRARKRYIGNAWSEREIRVFINGELVMKGISLAGVMGQLESIFTPQELLEMRSAYERGMPEEVTVFNIEEFIIPSRERISVLALLEESQHLQKRHFLNLASRHTGVGNTYFGICHATMLFNKETNTFYPNPVFERHGVSAAPCVLFFMGEEEIVRFGPELKWREIGKALNDLITG